MASTVKQGNSSDDAAQRHEQHGTEQGRRLAAVAQLAAGVAHDFNNILTVVVGIAERLTQQPRLPKSVREKLDLIAQQGHRGTQLIRQLTDFSRQSIVADRRPLDLSGLVAACRAELQRVIGDRARLTLTCPPGDHMVRGDAAQLRQIVAHLVSNAGDALAKGGEVRIGVARLALGPGAAPPVVDMPIGDWLVLSVVDTGTGMSADQLQHVFEPFFTTKEPGKGSGLGLAQVYGLVKQHGGFAGVVSKPGKGTTVTIYLPAASLRDDPPTADEGPRSRPGSGEVILLVEDEAAVRAVLKWQFEGMGYRVLQAATGEEALQLFASHPDAIALAVIDWRLPGMGGAQLYRSLRDVSPALPMIALSGYPPEVGASQAGIDRDERVQWLQKPAGLQPLARAVRRALKESPEGPAT